MTHIYISVQTDIPPDGEGRFFRALWIEENDEVIVPLRGITRATMPFWREYVSRVVGRQHREALLYREDVGE